MQQSLLHIQELQILQTNVWMLTLLWLRLEDQTWVKNHG